MYDSDVVVSKESKFSNIGNEHKYATETDDIVIEDGGCVRFGHKFVHLGCLIDFLLGDTDDVNKRISKGHK